jgi:hypothetical protein
MVPVAGTVELARVSDARHHAKAAGSARSRNQLELRNTSRLRVFMAKR